MIGSYERVLLRAELKEAEECLRHAGGAPCSTSIEELIEVARQLGVPCDDRRDDAPVFIAGTESLSTATWAQCGGVLFALTHDQVRHANAIGARVAHRIAELLPAHR